jgi:hypothetical protein
MIERVRRVICFSVHNQLAGKAGLQLAGKAGLQLAGKAGFAEHCCLGRFVSQCC